MLYLYRSNRLDVLVDALAKLGPPRADDAFVAETIVIQTRGLERWLGMELAKRIGVFANTRFISVEDYLAELCDRLEGAASDSDPWRPGRLAWPIAELLRAARDPAGPPDEELSGLKSWLASSATDDTGREPGEPKNAAMPQQVVELAWRIAEVFHRYTIYRPELLADWERHTDADVAGPQQDDLSFVDWQRALWRRLVNKIARPHPGRRIASLITRANTGPLDIAEPRLILFGHHTLPPLVIDALVALSAHVDIHVFRLNVALGNTRDEHVRQHPLRASLGRLADELTALLAERAKVAKVIDLFVEPDEDTLLGRLQSAIFHGLEREHLGAVDVADHSLQFHACSSELRQVEVLRDELLALFSTHRGLEPRDVIVMTPDIETYAPLVDAVFRDGDPNLPDDDPRSAGFPPIHRLHDRSLRRTNPVAESFLAVLDLVGGRHTLPQILDLMTLGPVLAKAGLEEEDLPKIQPLVVSAGVRWGDDEAHREYHGQPPYRRNTWRDGFDRLMCGHAMASDGLSTWQGIVPVDEVEGKEVEQLGLFIDYVERLFDELDGLTAPRTIPEWRAALTALTERLLVSDDESAGLAQPIFDELTALTDRAEHGGFTGQLDFAAIKALIVPPFEARRPSVSFLSGGLTFCTLLPMRTIPFKVVALLGMDSGAFPRASHGLGFDLMELEHEPGDRATRDDDRMTFLETLAAAQQHLIVTWTGIRATDRRELDAAGPVAELMEAVRRGLDPADTARQRSPIGLAELPEPILVKHPLQPFTPSNFQKARPLSFDLRYLSGAKRLVAERERLPAHWPTPLGRAQSDSHTQPPTHLSIDELARSIAKPAEWFCQHRLGVRLKRFERPLAEREPIALDGLERWQLRDRVLKWEVEGVPAAAREEALSASGVLPIGAAEKLALSEVEDAVRLIVDRVRELATSAPTAVQVDIVVDGIALDGTIGHVHLERSCRVMYQASSLKERDVIALWVNHLALTAALRRPMTSHLVCHDGHVQLRALSVTDAREHLRSLLAIHLLGRRGPLVFFPKTSKAWYDQRLTNPDAKELPSEVREAWRKRASLFEGDCDSADEHVALLFSDRLDDEDFPFTDRAFALTSESILAPLHPLFSHHELATPFVARGPR